MRDWRIGYLELSGDNPAAGLLRNSAIVSASITLSVVIRGFSDQPTISRLNRSSTIVRYSQPSSVDKYVMSDVQT